MTEVKPIAKSITFKLFQKDHPIKEFIEQILRFEREEDGKREVSLRRKVTMNEALARDNIDLGQLVENLEASVAQISKDEASKIARYLIEDSTSKADELVSVNVKVARQVLNNLLERELEGPESIQRAK